MDTASVRTHWEGALGTGQNSSPPLRERRHLRSLSGQGTFVEAWGMETTFQTSSSKGKEG